MAARQGSGTEGVDMSVRLGPLTLRNPVMTASGTFASGREYAGLVDLSRLGALVTKGVSLDPWPGNPSPRIAETASGMLNSIGLQNPGLEAFVEHDLAWLARQDVPVIVNVHGHAAGEFARICERLDGVAGVSGFELNVSCPNVDAGGMAFGTSCEGVAAVVRAAREATGKPVMVKLTPNVTDVVSIAKAAEDAGADAVSLINTLLGMAIDAETFKPRLGRIVGGLSGPAIKPVALRMVWQVAQAIAIPVVGMGGIMSGTDAAEFMLAGATAVAVGTATFVEPDACTRVADGLAEFCRRHGVERVSALSGALEA